MTQDRALELLKKGCNVLLTGPAGSGKTYVLNQFIEWAEKEGKKVAVTASTGIAATHLNGTTIHSWAGIGIKDVLSAYDMDALMQKEHLHKRFKSTDILIIDEISMLHSYRLDMVDRVLRVIRDRQDVPFGGIQIVLCGDFFQLPPIERNSKNTHFAFQAAVWEEMQLQVCYLDRVYRQADDPLLKILQEIRSGQVSEEMGELLMERGDVTPPDTITPTRLYTHNIDVDQQNAIELAKIPGAPKIFQMTSTGKKPHVVTLKKYCLAPEELQLKIGAQVMFVKNNFQEGYVNGTLGTVVEFVNDVPIVQTAEGKNITVPMESWAMTVGDSQVAQISQFPLRLAWAITVHKSQGMTLDAVSVDLSKSFVSGMGYVALSRVRSLDGLYITGMNRMALSVDPNVQHFDGQFQMQSALIAD